jgi:hypothetical protein
MERESLAVRPEYFEAEGSGAVADDYARGDGRDRACDLRVWDAQKRDVGARSVGAAAERARDVMAGSLQRCVERGTEPAPANHGQATGREVL